MIEFFGYETDKTAEENEEVIKDFITKKASKELLSDLDEVTKKIRAYETTMRKSSSSFTPFFFMASILSFIFFFIDANQMGFSKALEASSLYLILGCIFIVVFIGLFFYGKWKKSDVKKKMPVDKIDGEYQKYIKSRDNFFEAVNGINVDILASKMCHDKNGNLVFKNPFGLMSNLVVLAYVKDNRLCLCDNYFEYSFGLEEVSSFEFVNERTKLSRWNKKEPFNSDKYKEYNLHTSMNALETDGYGKMIIKHNNEEYIIRVASFDYQALKNLINI